MKPVSAFVALLRGVNVGGKNSLPMKDLASLATELGCADARTYIQSGNLVFRATEPQATALLEALPAAIEARFGFRPPLVIRPQSALAAVLADNPFLARGAAEESLHVAFLAGVPELARAAKLDPARSPPDAFELRGAELYLHTPNGLGRSKLTNDYLDRTLQTVSTVRNWKTVRALSALETAAPSPEPPPPRPTRARRG